MLSRKQWLWCADHHQIIKKITAVAASLLMALYCYIFLERFWWNNKIPIQYRPEISQMEKLNCGTYEVGEMFIPSANKMAALKGDLRNYVADPLERGDSRPLLLENYYTTILVTPSDGGNLITTTNKRTREATYQLQGASDGNVAANGNRSFHAGSKMHVFNGGTYLGSFADDHSGSLANGSKGAYRYDPTSGLISNTISHIGGSSVNGFRSRQTSNNGIDWSGPVYSFDNLNAAIAADRAACDRQSMGTIRCVPCRLPAKRIGLRWPTSVARKLWYSQWHSVGLQRTHDRQPDQGGAAA